MHNELADLIKPQAEKIMYGMSPYTQILAEDDNEKLAKAVILATEAIYEKYEKTHTTGMMFIREPACIYEFTILLDSR